MEILFLSHVDAVELEPGPGWVMISITDPGDEPAELQVGWQEILRLEFHDIDGPYEDFELFSWLDAFRVVRFAHRYRDTPKFVSHCRFGQSRSAAVARYVAWCRGLVLGEGANGYNQLVLRRLLAAHAVFALSRLKVNGLAAALSACFSSKA